MGDLVSGGWGGHEKAHGRPWAVLRGPGQGTGGIRPRSGGHGVGSGGVGGAGGGSRPGGRAPASVGEGESAQVVGEGGLVEAFEELRGGGVVDAADGVDELVLAHWMILVRRSGVCPDPIHRRGVGRISTV